MRSRIILYAVCIFFAACGVANAQQNGYSVTVKLVDEMSGDGVEFATVSLTPAGAKNASKYSLTDSKGSVTLKGVRSGKYSIKGEMMGYEAYSGEITVEKQSVDLGEVKMKVSVNFLEGAVVTDVGNPIVIKKDTIEFNATSFKTTDNDMLEDLLKKLPGVEVSSDGTVTSNGKEIKKITIDGKTFFLDDPQLATKNIPSKIVEKVKVIEKKSDQAEFTGIDDGNEETVIDLSIMKGMMNGWFGNMLAGGGSDLQDENNDFRFQGSAMVGRFNESDQIAFIGNANNTNNRGFNDMAASMMSGMRGGGMGRGGGGMTFRGNGISTSYMAGLNGSKTFDNKSELTGNYLFSGNEKDVTEKTTKTTLKSDGSSLISDNDGYSFTNTYGHRAGARADWKISDKTSILFEPQFNIGYGNFNEYSDFSTLSSTSAGNISTVNDGNKHSYGDNDSQTMEGRLLLRQRLGKPGRTISLNVDFSHSNNTIDGYNRSLTNLYEDEAIADSTVVDQMYHQNAKAFSISGRLSYTEPLGGNYFLEGTYSYDYSESKSIKNTYNKDSGGDYSVIDDVYSNQIDNTAINQRAGLNVMKQEDKYNLTVGVTAQPSKTENVTVVSNEERVIKQNVLNWAPNARFDYNFSDDRMIRLRYRGRTSQPTVTQLQPVEDNSDPLNLKRGNPNLHPSFSHSLNTMFFSNNRQTFSSLNANIDMTYNTNNIVNASWTDADGVTYTVPMNNEKGTFSTEARLMFNSPIAKSKFSIMSATSGSYGNSMSFVGNESVLDGNNEESYLNPDNFAENRYQTVGIREFLRFTYRDNYIEVTLGESTRYSKSWYEITTTEVNATWTNSLTSSVNLTIPNVMGIVTDVRYTFYNGYDEGYNDPTFVWNAELNKQIFKGRATLALKAYDILNQSKNTYRTISDNYIQDVQNNTLGRYVILSFTYRFGTFGGGRDRGGMRGGHGGMYGGPGMGRPPMRM